jgi:hypothetical protein
MRSIRIGKYLALIAAWPAVPVAALPAACSSSSTSTLEPPSIGSGPAVSSTSPTTGPPTTGPPTTAARPTSCSVVTQAEAGAALGQQVKAPIRGKAVVEGGVACVFYGPQVPPGTSPDVPVGDSVRVVLVTGSNAKKWFDDYRGKVNAKPIPGLGDEAYYDGYASISVLKGDAYVRIAVGVANNLAAEETLARDALPRM